MNFAKVDPDFITVTCLQWKRILADERAKDIVIDSLRYLSNKKRVNVFAFVIMNNHIHLIWQMLGDHRREDVQRDFLKYTGQRILQLLRNNKSPLLDELHVEAKDRKYQVWERNSLSIPLYSDKFFMQKFSYIHKNPVTAGMCRFPEEYYYSSAGFYYRNITDFDFLVHFEG